LARLSCLAEQMTDKPRAVLAYLTHPFLLTRAFLQWIESNECYNLFLSPESTDIAQLMNKCQCIDRPNTGMRLLV
jgi:hypothetical protein